MFPVFQPESPQAQAIYDLFLLVLVISGAIFTIVAALIVVAVWRGRGRGSLPVQDFGSHRAEIFWMVGPVIVVLWITAISANLILTINAVPKAHPPRDQTTEPEITVIGHQWWWEVHYHDTGLVAANELHIPAGRKIRVQLQSADVIHCFWVPQLARKIDVIPGRDNYVWLEASTPGVYQGRCAEYCGTQHAWMNFKVYAMTDADLERWQKTQTGPPPDRANADADAVAGERLFFAHTCANCHTIQGTTAAATIGPDLTHIASRQELGGGVLQNSRENLIRWMKNPQAIKPGSKMPDFKLDEDQARQIAAYLESVD